MEEIDDVFGELEDPRTGNARLHSFHEILLIALCTVLCGGEGCSDMALFGRSKRAFLGRFLKLENGVPSHDTFSRVFRLLDPERFHAWFIDYMKRFAETCEGVVAIDAIGCQRKIAQDIVDRNADYVLALKGNQGSLHDDVRRFLDDPETPLATAHEVDKGHGRIETRKAALSTDIGWLQDLHTWPGLQAVGKITATREIDLKETSETRYYLLSRADTPERFNNVVRSHWGIENRLHWVLDVVFDEDQARNRKDHGPENLALLRKLALNLAKLDPSKGSMRGKLKCAAWDDQFLANLLSRFAQVQVR